MYMYIYMYIYIYIYLYISRTNASLSFYHSLILLTAFTRGTITRCPSRPGSIIYHNERRKDTDRTKMAEVTVAWKLIEFYRFINVSRTFFKKSS